MSEARYAQMRGGMHRLWGGAYKSPKAHTRALGYIREP
jgi:hypothetical protein